MDSKALPRDIPESAEVETPKFQTGRVREFPFEQLQKATDCFRDENILGRGGFGIVYKGCLTDGSLVAIKRLVQEKNTPEGKQQFQREIEMIGLAVHRNLLRLYGFCITPNECLLVYPYMANGSVAARLKGAQEALAPLSWPTRVNVAHGVAKALAYLHDHCNPKIIHRDVKADNVLLDDEYEAVVADFGLVRLINYKDSHVTTGVCGTIGHIAPEYFTNSRCSEKTDVYGYGIFLLELITGKRVYNIIPPSKRDETMLFDWIRELVKNKDLEFLVDHNLLGNYAYDDLGELIRVALLCTQYSPKERPQMSKVVRMLEDYRSDTGKINRGSSKQPTKLSQEKLRCFQFYRLEYGTDFFSKNNVVGRGSFGKVYKARLEDGTLVTVKRLEEHTSKGEFQYKAEALAMKNRIKHPNLLPILGFCKSRQERILVYPFMEKGTLASYLKGYPNSAHFDPLMQKKIALGVARGLSYLHNSAPTIHGDLNAKNIWLDESFNTFVGDIGLYHPEDSSLEESISGTPGFIAPEHLQTNKYTNKTDFAFGVLLLELLTGLRAFDFYWLSLEGKQFAQGNMLVNVIRFFLREFGYARLDDCKLISHVAIRKEETEKLLQLALLCTQSSDMNRPKISKVVEILEGEEWPTVLTWRDVLKEVHFQQDIGNKNKKRVSASHGNGTADEEQRMATLKKWINEFPRMRWWNAIPAINRFPYLKESELSQEVQDGNLSALRRRYADWFGERM